MRWIRKWPVVGLFRRLLGKPDRRQAKVSKTRSVGFVELGKSYLDAARHLEAGIETKTLRLRFGHPVDALLAHALELMLKGCLIEDDPAREVADYGHNLARLYAAARASAFGKPLIETAEGEVLRQWRERLRAARDRHQAAIGLSGEAAREFGILDDAAIDKALTALNLRRQVEWLSVRHAKGGSRFRYLEPGLDQRPQIEAFGLTDDVVRRSLGWGCAAIHSGFVARWQERHNRP